LRLTIRLASSDPRFPIEGRPRQPDDFVPEADQNGFRDHAALLANARWNFKRVKSFSGRGGKLTSKEATNQFAASVSLNDAAHISLILCQPRSALKK
jgi:hypothetical protein